MKIALCIYSNGNKINIVELSRWKEFFSKFDCELDIFCHFWDNNFDYEFNNLDTFNSEKKLFFSLINPKKYLIENEDKKNLIIKDLKKYNIINEICENGFDTYSLMRSVFLKKQYEAMNHILYDVCFGLCIDKTFTDIELKKIKKLFILPESKSVYTYDSHEISYYPYFNVDYKFFYSDTLTLNKLGEFYRFIPLFAKKYDTKEYTPEGASFGFYIKSLKISNKNNKLNEKV